MNPDVLRVIITRDQIARRVRQLADDIIRDHCSPDAATPGPITIVPILTGAMIFCADLIRQMPLRLKIDLLTVSSYPGTATTSQGAALLASQLGDIRGCHVLLVDDILDSGNTLKLVCPLIRAMGPASLRVAVLLRKTRPDPRPLSVDYVGFDIPNEFVVGYGLDYNNYYRNLPDIVTLRPDAMAAAGGGR